MFNIRVRFFLGQTRIPLGPDFFLAYGRIFIRGGLIMKKNIKKTITIKHVERDGL